MGMLERINEGENDSPMSTAPPSTGDHSRLRRPSNPSSRSQKGTILHTANTESQLPADW